MGDSSAGDTGRDRRGWRGAFREWQGWKAMAPWRWRSPAQLLVGSFALLVLLGTLGLRWLPGLYVGPSLGWLDALFTATSAVCVTGLVVADTGSRFTLTGQGFLLLLIQLGGLGILTFSTAVIVALGRRLSLAHEAATGGVAEVVPEIDLRQLAASVVGFTLTFEAVGFGCLYFLWLPHFGAAETLRHAVFHAVSAFCNAGFSTFPDSLAGFARSTPTQLVIMGLVVAGGVGFVTLEELRFHWRVRRAGRRHRLSLHTRLVLVTTGALLLIGWVLFVLFEWDVGLGSLPPWARVLNGLFLSVTARTAGFATLDYAQLSDASCFLTILLMFVGGSPGSTAGGIKTTTVAVLVVLALSRMGGEEVARAWHRSIPEETVQRAMGLFVLAAVLISGAIFVLTATEVGHVPHPLASGSFLRHAFEVASAFNTVGLSMGTTPQLSVPGRLLIVLLMFVGRVGPLSVAAALVLRQRRRRGRLRYAFEDVVIG